MEPLREPAPGVAWAALRTPTLPPAKFTNVAAFGEQHFAVVDAGATDPGEREELSQFIQARIDRGHRFAALLLTHHHPDHVGAMDYLRTRFSVPLYGHKDCQARIDFKLDHNVREGDRIELGPGETIRVHETPGHAQGHVVYVHIPSRWCYAGDLVIGKGSVLIDQRDGGCVSKYLASLRRLAGQCDPKDAQAITALIPGHGDAILDPQGRIAELVSHRLYRERQVLSILGAGPQLEASIIDQIYADKPKSVLPFARATVLSHLQKLADEGQVQRTGPSSWARLSPISPSLG